MLGLHLVLASILVAPPALREVRVPPALAAVTSAPELSGLTWSAALDRFLVVSDDTGVRARGTSHGPILLALDAAGTLDEVPVPIAGLEKLNDPEAICAGPDGRFYLVTSHSPNREGRTPRARRQLLALELRGRSLVVRGRLDLTEVEGGRPLLALAGLDPAGRLDIEGLAWRDGALFVGLKSPLTAGGGALILRLDRAEATLRAGRIPEGALSRWEEVPLCLEAGAGRVCQGIADMLFLDDGALLLAANAPKGGPDDGGGALWTVRPGAGAPRLLRRFPGLKPEGLAFTRSRKAVAVVFDRGGGQPAQWTEIPVPAP